METERTPGRSPYRCEAAGCPAAAEWTLIPQDEADTPQYLCDKHWDALKARNPSAASRFVPVATNRSGK